jgi:hypothetical protein
LRAGSTSPATSSRETLSFRRSRTPAGSTASSTSPRRAIHRSAIHSASASIRRESSGLSSSTPATSLSGVCGSSPDRTATQ